MRQQPIIRRTEKLRTLASLLKEKRIVYISAFLYSGKTMLLDQFCDMCSGKVFRFCSNRDDWSSFRAGISDTEEALIVIDSIDNPSDIMSEELGGMITGLPDKHCLILAGRGQAPSLFYRFYISGMMAVLGKEYMMFDEEEVVQLFLEYDIDLLPSQVRLIRERLWGWAFGLHILAQLIQNNSGQSFQTLVEDTREEIMRILISETASRFSEQEWQMMYNLSPFDSFTEDMARFLTGRNDAPRMMEEIARKSYMLLRGRNKEYSFIPIVRQAMFAEMQNLYSRDYINGQYKRAALYFELQDQIPKAISCYRQLGDVEKVRELLIRDTFNRPADGDYVDLRDGYALLEEKTILAYPELMKGKCEIECLMGHAEESERWYGELEKFIQRMPAKDVRRRAAEEAKAYLDLCLSHRGTKHTLRRLIAVAKSPELRQSDVWRNGFNVSGNSVSLMNGGLDFCRWVPHGWNIYRLFKTPVELALGRGGSGVADIAIAERELEANTDGDYTVAMAKVRAGMQRIFDNLEMQYAAIGIQCRIETARGNVEEALHMIGNAIRDLPAQHPRRLLENLEVFRHTLSLLLGEIADAGNWLDTKAPDETGSFIIMDRYKYMLKLKLYLIQDRRREVPFLAALLRQYFESYDRPYMLIQLNLLEAVYHYRGGDVAWQGRMQEALNLAKRYSLIRVIADEGIAVIDMLSELSLPKEPWEQSVLELTRRQAAFYPNYLKQAAQKPVFTDREYQVYSLMIAGYKNAKIASILNISERTVKYFCGQIYKKLGVATRAEALNRAAELGDIR